MKNVPFTNAKITDGFWAKRQKLERETIIKAVYEQFDASGRIGAFRCDWKEGMDKEPHFFWDSDVYKWMESVAYLAAEERCPELETAVDSIVDNIEKNQDENGYFNIYFTVKEPQNRFAFRGAHELYCLGHMIEAGIAYFEATGKDKLLRCAKKYVDLVDRTFRIEHSAAFTTPGHEEIEIALMKLYRLTGEERYRDLAAFFLDNRGTGAKGDDADAQTQSDIPVREMKDARGHSVRATYLYTAMAELALSTGDEELKAACLRMFDSIVNRRMYITGGIGSNPVGEQFSDDYYLPNANAYAESCAAIGLAFFCLRMQELDPGNPAYADIIERVLYNGFLSSYSIDGEKFFYENPLEIPPKSTKPAGVRFPITERVRVFWCSCCPPNITRFIPTIGGYVYGVDGDTVYVHQYMTSEVTLNVGGRDVTVKQTTSYPDSGKVTVSADGDVKLALRVPSWSEAYGAGYMPVELSEGESVTVDFEVKPRWIDADVRVNENAGRSALTYGPRIYCMEAVDNGDYLRSVRIREDAPVTAVFDSTVGETALEVPARKRGQKNALYAPHSGVKEEPFTAHFIPYHTFANRGETEMLIWTVLD